MHRASGHAPKAHKVVNHGADTLHRLLNVMHRLAPLLGAEALMVMVEQFRRGLDSGQRRAKLVRGHRHKARFQITELFFLGQGLAHFFFRIALCGHVADKKQKRRGLGQINHGAKHLAPRDQCVCFNAQRRRRNSARFKAV